MAEPTPLRAPRIRRALVPDDAVLVVRGDDLDPATSYHQAQAFRRRYPDWGRYGLSAYYARDDAEIDDLASDQLERFPALAVLEISVLESCGFEVVPTFRTPHVTIAFAEDLEEGLDLLTRRVSRVLVNKYHEEEPSL